MKTAQIKYDIQGNNFEEALKKFVVPLPLNHKTKSKEKKFDQLTTEHSLPPIIIQNQQYHNSPLDSEQNRSIDNYIFNKNERSLRLTNYHSIRNKSMKTLKNDSSSASFDHSKKSFLQTISHNFSVLNTRVLNPDVPAATQVDKLLIKISDTLKFKLLVFDNFIQKLSMQMTTLCTSVLTNIQMSNETSDKTITFLISSIVGVLSYLESDYQTKKSKMEELTNEMQKIRSELAESKSKVAALTKGMVKNKSSETNDDNEQTTYEINNWMIERGKFLSIINELQEKLINQTKEAVVANLKNENEQLKSLSKNIFEKYEHKLRQKDIIISKLEFERISNKTISTNRELEFDQIFEKLTNLELAHSKLQKDFETSETKQNTFREISYMSAEEIYILQSRIFQLEKTINELKKKNSEFSRKKAELTREQDSVIKVGSSEDFEKDEDHLKTIKEIFLKSAVTYNKKIVEDQLSYNASSKQVNITSENKIQNLAYFRPTFYSLIEDSYIAFINKKKLGSEPFVMKSAQKFFSQMRAMLDSKFREILVADNRKDFTRFVDFAFSWLGNFTIDLENKKIIPLTQMHYDNIDDVRVEFYHNLYHGRYSKLWEVIVFREILEEKLSSDQLFFLLTCRNIILNGEQFENYSHFEIIHYVKWVNITLSLENIFKKFDGSITQDILSKIKKKTKEKNGQRIIEPYFLLKVLTELYILDMNKKYFQLRSVFNMLPNISKSMTKISVSFDSFRKVLELNFPNCTELEKAQLYRDSFNAGNSFVNVDSFFTVASESNFFNKQIRIRNNINLCNLNEEGEIVVKNFDTQMADQIYKFTQNYAQMLNSFEQSTKSLGLENYTSDINRTAVIIRNKFQADLTELNNQNYFQITLSMIMKTFKGVCGQFFNQLDIKKMRGEENFVLENLINLLSDYKILYRRIEMIKNINKIKELENNRKLVFLQRFLKKRYSIAPS